jgi:plasmid segregation protein ParM
MEIPVAKAPLVVMICIKVRSASWSKASRTIEDIEKRKVKDILIGHHNFMVNGAHKNITIKAVEVATEGGGAFWSNPDNGTIRVLDIGSGTVNSIIVKDKRHINNVSETFNFGVETIKNKSDLDGVSRGIIRNTTKLKWQKNDRVYVCGGIAEQIGPFKDEHFANSEVIYPQCQGGTIAVQSVFANAVGFYNIAKGIYQ